MTKFVVGDVVKSKVTTDKLVKGETYKVAEVDEMHTVAGTVVTYLLAGTDGRQRWVSNGHLLLSKVEGEALDESDKVKASEVYADTRAYEATYNHGPRGRGSWAFEFDGDKEVWWARKNGGLSMTYGEAKKLAVKEAVRRGVYGFVVLT